MKFHYYEKNLSTQTDGNDKYNSRFLQIFKQTIENFSNMKFHENSTSTIRVLPRVYTDMKNSYCSLSQVIEQNFEKFQLSNSMKFRPV